MSGLMRDGVVYVIDQHGGKESTNYSKVVYIMDAMAGNSMKSSNPNSGIHTAEISKCLDTQCLNPACNNGGVMIVEQTACYRKATKPGNGSAETWVQDDITNTLNGYEFHSPVRTPEVIVGCDMYNGELTGDKAATLGANSCQSANHAGPSVIVYDARGNGEGGIVPTLAGDHQNRITDYTAIILEGLN